MAEPHAIDRAIAGMQERAAKIVGCQLEAGARDYCRARHLHRVTGTLFWDHDTLEQVHVDDASTAQIVRHLEHLIECWSRNRLHWTFDGNRLLAARQALAAEEERLAVEMEYGKLEVA